MAREREWGVAHAAIPPADAILRVARVISSHLRLTVFNFDIMRGAAGGAVHACVACGRVFVPCRVFRVGSSHAPVVVHCVEVY